MASGHPVNDNGQKHPDQREKDRMGRAVLQHIQLATARALGPYDAQSCSEK